MPLASPRPNHDPQVEWGGLRLKYGQQTLALWSDSPPESHLWPDVGPGVGIYSEVLQVILTLGQTEIPCEREFWGKWDSSGAGPPEGDVWAEKLPTVWWVGKSLPGRRNGQGKGPVEGGHGADCTLRPSISGSRQLLVLCLQLLPWDQWTSSAPKSWQAVPWRTCGTWRGGCCVCFGLWVRGGCHARRG